MDIVAICLTSHGDRILENPEMSLNFWCPGKSLKVLENVFLPSVLESPWMIFSAVSLSWSSQFLAVHLNQPRVIFEIEGSIHQTYKRALFSYKKISKSTSIAPNSWHIYNPFDKTNHWVQCPRARWGFGLKLTLPTIASLLDILWNYEWFTLRE